MIPFQIELRTDRVIRGDYWSCPGDSKGLLIICHGFKGFKDWGFFPYIAKQFSEMMDVITFNFSHNGVGEELTQFTELEKFARNTYTAELEDLHFLIHSIKNNHVDGVPEELAKLPIFLLGHSRGGGVSILYALDHPEEIQAVVSWNGITNVDLFSTDVKQSMRTTGRGYIFNARTKQEMPLDLVILEDMEVNKERFNMMNRIKKATFPIALIQGTNDFPHFIQGSHDLCVQNPDIKWVKIEGGSHTFDTVHPFQGETKALQEAIFETKQFLNDHS